MKTKFLDMLVSAIVKRGIIWEVRDISAEIPVGENGGTIIKVKIPHMLAKLETREEADNI